MIDDIEIVTALINLTTAILSFASMVTVIWFNNRH
jgi:hypothetical protein